MNGESLRLVTVGGECFEAAPRGVREYPGRDGLLYKFHLTDMVRNRGKRVVSLFASGTLGVVVAGQKPRIPVVCLNAIRRAFGDGALSFDGPFDENQYTELSLLESDFQPQGARTDVEVRQYIIHKAYWLAYRFPMEPQPTGIIYPIPFDEPADLDYLGVTPPDVWRNVRRLGNQDLLEKVSEGHARPTERLLSQYESDDRQALGFAALDSTARGAKGETDDRRFERVAIEEARKSVPEDKRVHPKVGVVVVKNGRVLATAHRGEIPQCHAEYIALERKLAEDSLSGATVYTTLEPCTSRNHPKVPCAIRLTERKVTRVVVGMLDPDGRISGRGLRALRKAGIATELFPDDLMAEIEELNRDFIREREAAEKKGPGPENRDTAAVSKPIPPQAQAARALCDATRELERAAWSYVGLHSQYLVARAARDLADEEGRILEKVESALRVFERDYDLPADLARVAKDELGRINIALHRLRSGRQPDTMKIAAEQVGDACRKIQDAARPYAYLKSIT